MKKHIQDIAGACIGGITGWISQGFYKEWIQPMILAAACAFIGLLVTHYGKKIFQWLDGKLKDNNWKHNGRHDN